MLWWWIVGFYGLQTMCMVVSFKWQENILSFSNTLLSWNNAILMFMLKHQWCMFLIVFFANITFQHTKMYLGEYLIYTNYIYAHIKCFQRTSRRFTLFHIAVMMGLQGQLLVACDFIQSASGWWFVVNNVYFIWTSLNCIFSYMIFSLLQKLWEPFV
jgi:hypothetical protein